MSEIRVRFEPEYEALEDTFDEDWYDIPKLYRQIASGELEYMYAIVERQCCECGSWEMIDSLGCILAEPGSECWKEVERDLLEEHRAA